MAENSEWQKPQSEPHDTSREPPGKSSADNSQDTEEMERILLDEDMTRNIREEQIEWRRKNAEKSQAIEELGQGIRHLFPYYDSPQEFEPYKLPDRLPERPSVLFKDLHVQGTVTRDTQVYFTTASVYPSFLTKSICASCWLQLSSSCSDQSTPRKKHRNQTRKQQEQEQNQEQAVTLFRASAKINLQGPLTRTTDINIYNKMIYHQNRHPNPDFFSSVKRRFELSRRDDMAVMTMIIGINAAQFWTGDTQQALTRCKQILRNMHTCQLTNPGITEARVYWNMCNYYKYKGKPGKSHSAMKAAMSCIQHHAPSAWTAMMGYSQGGMYDSLAQVSPGHRREYQDQALRCYTNAIEHHLHQPCQEEEDYSFHPLYYTTHLIHIKLDMPTLNTIEAYRASDAVYQRLCESVVTQRQVNEAQDMMRTVTPHIHTLTTWWRPVINERVLICDIILNIRLTQLAITDKDYKSGLKYITTSAKLCDEWCDIGSIYKDTSLAWLKKFPHLLRDAKKVLDYLQDRLVLMPLPHPAPQPEPSSDSLSSEPSDAPPSGLKQLTDASQRAEKQARRDAYEFPYSSGDIYTDSQDDVSTD